jgi:hypothetical protein
MCVAGGGAQFGVSKFWRSRERDLQPVEQSGSSSRDNDASVPTGPEQTIQTGGDIRLNGRSLL